MYEIEVVRHTNGELETEMVLAVKCGGKVVKVIDIGLAANADNSDMFDTSVVRPNPNEYSVLAFGGLRGWVNVHPDGVIVADVIK